MIRPQGKTQTHGTTTVEVINVTASTPIKTFFTVPQPTMYIYGESNSTSTKSFVFVFIILGLMLTISAIVATVAYIIKKEGNDTEKEAASVGNEPEKHEVKNKDKGKVNSKDIMTRSNSSRQAIQSPGSKLSQRSLTFINAIPCELRGARSPITSKPHKYHHRKCSQNMSVGSRELSPSSSVIVELKHNTRQQRKTATRIMGSFEKLQTADNSSAYDPDDDTYFIANISPRMNGWTRGGSSYCDTDSTCGSGSLQSKTPLLYQLSGSHSGGSHASRTGTPLAALPPPFLAYPGTDVVIKPSKKSRSEGLKRKKRESTKAQHPYHGKHSMSTVLWGEDTKRAILERFDINNYVNNGTKNSDSEMGTMLNNSRCSMLGNKRSSSDIISQYFNNEPQCFSSNFPNLDKYEFL